MGCAGSRDDERRTSCLVFDLDVLEECVTHDDWIWDRHELEDLTMTEVDGWVFEEDEEDGGAIDPHDTLASPDRRQRVRTHDDERERRERHADDALSDFGSGAIHRRYSRHEED
jgi:hypothetical protein